AYKPFGAEDGMLYIKRDVSGRGTNTEENLRNGLGAYGLTLEKLSENERSQALAALNQMGRNASGKSAPPAPPQQFINAAIGPSPVATPSKKGKERSRKVATASGRVTRHDKSEQKLVILMASLPVKGHP